LFDLFQIIYNVFCHDILATSSQHQTLKHKLLLYNISILWYIAWKKDDVNKCDDTMYNPV